MILLAYDSCEETAKELEILYDFLIENSFDYERILTAGEHSYADIETQIEHADIYLCIIGAGLDGSTWLNHCLSYAYSLNKYRMGRNKPIILGYKINGFEIPACSQNIEMKIIKQLTLEDFKL